jgi:hypothetical protein
MMRTTNERNPGCGEQHRDKVPSSAQILSPITGRIDSRDFHMPSVRADAIHVGIGVTRVAHKNWHAIDEKIIPVKVPFAI